MEPAGTWEENYRIARSYNFAVVHYILVNKVLCIHAGYSQQLLVIGYHTCQNKIHTMYLVICYLLLLK